MLHVGLDLSSGVQAGTPGGDSARIAPSIDLDLTPGAKANKHSGDTGRGNQHGG